MIKSSLKWIWHMGNEKKKMHRIYWNRCIKEFHNNIKNGKIKGIGDLDPNRDQPVGQGAFPICLPYFHIRYIRPLFQLHLKYYYCLVLSDHTSPTPHCVSRVNWLLSSWTVTWTHNRVKTMVDVTCHKSIFRIPSCLLTNSLIQSWRFTKNLIYLKRILGICKWHKLPCRWQQYLATPCNLWKTELSTSLEARLLFSKQTVYSLKIIIPQSSSHYTSHLAEYISLYLTRGVCVSQRIQPIWVITLLNEAASKRHSSTWARPFIMFNKAWISSLWGKKEMKL